MKINYYFKLNLIYLDVNINNLKIFYNCSISFIYKMYKYEDLFE
jgi:hypothetical protein